MIASGWWAGESGGKASHGLGLSCVGRAWISSDFLRYFYQTEKNVLVGPGCDQNKDTMLCPSEVGIRGRVKKSYH